jgi:hypothetical protein
MSACSNCHEPYQPGPNAWRGFCKPCYRRFVDHGYPVAGPPPARSGLGPKSDLAARIEDYAELRSWGLSRAEAAVRLGLCRRTMARYDARLREYPEMADCGSAGAA